MTQTTSNRTDAPVAPLPSGGILVVDKPQGVTSHDVVGAVRGALHLRKVGHAGTLDPMATGVLVVGFGDATRLLNTIVGTRKTYEATIRFGQATDSDDADGTPVHAVADAAGLPTVQAVRDAIDARFTGDIMQVPNAFSAVKVHGRRAYDLARDGQAPELKARPVTIHRFDALAARHGQADDGTPVLDVDVRVTCSAGTYIRALARDLGQDFGCGAHLVRLRRLAVGQFTADDGRLVHAHAESRTVTDREGRQVERRRAVLDAPRGLADHVIGMMEAVTRTMPVVEVDGTQARDLRFGRQLRGGLEGIAAAVVPAGGDVVAIVRGHDGMIQPVTVFAGGAGPAVAQ
ncbi:tRNA pseudouridine(55) synthase TruB [Bifidobacterium cuniculi]|uniref:tRNA pseudouridine(55) synthase TruB n=1 Tax=Bifidobacterium cuniculi TaxID=1688 RepID=UPI00068FC79C|nr:tRNA pseudouridine(55) synthase TruB [Bifidobacterium cuniculi]